MGACAVGGGAHRGADPGVFGVVKLARQLRVLSVHLPAAQQHQRLGSGANGDTSQHLLRWSHVKKEERAVEIFVAFRDAISGR